MTALDAVTRETARQARTVTYDLTDGPHPYLVLTVALSDFAEKHRTLAEEHHAGEWVDVAGEWVAVAEWMLALAENALDQKPQDAAGSDGQS